ncbi:MAG: TrmH family RNA methyltransferase [Spirochaetales bacterium]|nr:TrmH family RNA methyltransferase [Spirochaetales bacterium]
MEIGLARGQKPDPAYLKAVYGLAREKLSEQAAKARPVLKQAAASKQALSKQADNARQAAQSTQSRQSAQSQGPLTRKTAETAQSEHGAQSQGPLTRKTASKQAADVRQTAGLSEKLCLEELEPSELLRVLNDLRHEILSALGAEPAEWDFLDFDRGLLDRASRIVLPLRVYMEDIRSPFNVGSIFRTAEAFAVKHVYLSSHTPLPTHKKAAKTARGCEKIVDWSVEPLSVLEKNVGVFALELGGTPVHEFTFPKRGTVLIGSEELGLSPEALALADAGLGRVSIPMAGAKRSLNVATAFGILMQSWYTAITAKV